MSAEFKARLAGGGGVLEPEMRWGFDQEGDRVLKPLPPMYALSTRVCVCKPQMGCDRQPTTRTLGSHRSATAQPTTRTGFASLSPSPAHNPNWVCIAQPQPSPQLSEG